MSAADMGTESEAKSQRHHQRHTDIGRRRHRIVIGSIVMTNIDAVINPKLPRPPAACP